LRILATQYCNSRLEKAAYWGLFVVYLTTLFSNYDYIASNEMLISTFELERIWKEAVVA
jgi:hypothetical protein